MSATVRPPGPRDSLIGISLVRRINRDSLGFYQEMQREFGDVVYMRFGPYHDYTFFHPTAVRELLVGKAKHFVRMKRVMDVFGQWNGNSVLIAEGQDWLRQRRILQPAFNQRRFESYANEVTAATAELLKSLSRASELIAVEFEKTMADLSTAVICRTMFGTDLGEELPNVRRAVRILSQTALREMLAMMPLPDWLPLASKREKRWAIRTLDGMVRRIIRERRSSGTDRGDLLSMMLLAVDEEGDGQGLTDEEVRDNCMTIFLAGHDTTAAGLIWLGWVLASLPEIAERAAAEVAHVFGDRLPVHADLARLTYVEQIVKETLRVYPPAIAPFGRQAIDDVEIGGWSIPRGAFVHAITYVTHHDPRWFPNPEVFEPERFAAGCVEDIPAGAYLPFGLGPRVCIGNHFATMEMMLVAVMLLQRFILSLADGQGQPRLHPGASLRPVGGLRLNLRPRS